MLFHYSAILAEWPDSTEVAKRGCRLILLVLRWLQYPPGSGREDNEAMKIELFLESIDQDFSAQTVKAGVGVDESRAGWSNWNNWTNWDNWTNWTNWNNAALTESPHAAAFRHLRVRQESFGGLAFDPSTRRIYKLDKEAYDALLLLAYNISPECASYDVEMAIQDFDQFFSTSDVEKCNCTK